MSLIEVNVTVLLRRAARTDPDTVLAEGQELIELGVEDAARIARADQCNGRRGDLARIRRRFAHGFRYFAVSEPQEIVAWFWVVHGVPRYLDELCWQVALDETQVWARDVFVVPKRRGTRLMRAMMDMACTVDARPAYYFSDVSWSNRISLRAHRSLGFERFATVWSVGLGERMVLRSRPPAGMPAARAIRPARRCLWLSQEELDWHRQQIA